MRYDRPQCRVTLQTKHPLPSVFAKCCAGDPTCDGRVHVVVETPRGALGEKTTRRSYEHPFHSFWLELEGCCTLQGHGNWLGEYQLTQPLSLGLLNRRSANLFPDYA